LINRLFLFGIKSFFHILLKMEFRLTEIKICHRTSILRELLKKLN